MGNETDLDWLVRNEHYWPEGAVYVSRHENAVKWHYVELVFKGLGHFTKDQWLSRRAELQNKPSWKDAPVWVEWIAQDDDGEWKWLGSNPSKYINGWTANKLSCCKKMGSYGSVIEKGTILGDWRDTLEKRPEEFKPSIEEANRLAQEFKLLTGIEDNQEQDMKQDNKWFERGELPPVGSQCEVMHRDSWVVCDVIAYFQQKAAMVAAYTVDNVNALKKLDSCIAKYFRPIRTERDVLLSVIVEEMNHYDTDGKLADAILAAGFSLRAK